MASAPDFECLPSVEPHLPCDKLLSIREPEAGLQYPHVPDVAKPGKRGPDLGCDEIVPFTMAAPILFGLLFEVFDIRHRRTWYLLSVGGRPFDLHRCALGSI
jgi:hypothetical protein